MNTTISTFSRWRRKYLKEMLLLPLFFVLALLQGYRLGVGDLSTYLAFVWHAADPALFQNDLLIRTLSDHPVYIWSVVGQLLHFAGIQTVFQLLFLVQTAIIIVGTYGFYRQFFGKDDGWILLLLTLTLTSSAAAMGKYGLNPYGYFHPNVLAVGVALMGLTQLDRGSWISGALLSGSIFLYHPFTAIYAGLFFAYQLILNRKKTPPARLGMAVLVYLLISSPSWAPFIIRFLSGPATGVDMALWLSLVQKRMQFSFFISQWVPDRLIHLTLAFAAIAFFRKHPAFRRTLPIVLGVLTALLLFALADLFKNQLLLRLQLARCSYFIFIVLAAYIGNAIFGESPQHKKGAAILLMLAGYLLMLETVLDKSGFPLRWAVFAMCIAGLLWIITLWPAYRRHIYLFFGFTIVITATAGITIQRYQQHQRMIDSTHTTEWETLQTWCAEKIPVDEVIMTPMYIEGFRSFSKRAIYGSYKDGAPHNYSNATFPVWWERMQALGVTLDWERGRFPALYHQHCMAVAQANGLRYVVIEPRYGAPSGAAIYRNSQFTVIDRMISAGP